MKVNKTKKGISLITLVITIIIVIILAAAVILTLNNNNPIENAKEATFKSDVATIQDDLNLYVANEYAKTTGTFDVATLNLNETTTPKITEVLTSVGNSKLKGKVAVQNGKLVFTGADETENTWFEEIIMVEKENIGEGTRRKAKSAWNKPYVPSDFHYVEGTVATGYVIADDAGNEFVWIPVDGTNVTYAKHYTTNTDYKDVENDEYPEGITKETEKSIVEKVGGFYIGRYEAGVPAGQTEIDGESVATSNKSGIPVSKKGAKVWTNIDYTNANANARAYKNNAEVASGLMSGTSWDTVCKWLQNSSYNVTDSRAWGNHKDSISPANVTGFKNKQTAGYSDKWKANNIYDLAGNTWEWSYELSLSNLRNVYRGGYYNYSGSSSVFPASSHTNTVMFGITDSGVGFRMEIYIK